MKKLLSILMLLVAIVIGANAGTEPTYQTSNWTSADDITAAITNHVTEGVTLFTTQGSSGNYSSSSVRYLAMGSSPSGYNAEHHFGIKANNGEIDSIAVCFAVNGTGDHNLAVIGWKKGTTPSSNVDYHSTTPLVSGTKSADDLKWQTIDVHELGLSEIRVARQWKSLKESDGTTSISNFGANKTINISGIKIWLKPAAPSGKTATTTTITSDSKAALNLDLKNGTTAGTLAATVVSGDPATVVEGAVISWSSSNIGVAEINASTGAVTLKATGTTTLNAIYEGDETYDGSNDSYQITVTDTRTALTASWDNAAPLFPIGETATNPVFTVTGGEAVLGTDYSVAYEKVSGNDLATIDATGITAIETSAAGTETIKATVTVINGDYKIATTEYNCVITVASTNTLTYNANGGSGEMGNTVGYGSITLSANKYTKSGYTFMGWATSQSDATSGIVSYADEAAYTLSEDATIYAVWAVTDIYFVPATSGDAPASGDKINMQSSSFGGSMTALSANLSYTASGLQFGTNSSTKASVTLDRNLKAGSVIVMTLVSAGTSARGLHLYSADGSKKITTIGWSSTVESGAVKTFSYEVKSTDTDLIGSNGFQLWRNNTVILTNLSIVDTAEPVKVELNNVDGFNYGFAGFCAPKNFSVTNGTAYKAVVTDNKMVLKSLDGIVPANEGVVIAGTKGASATISYTTDDATVDVSDNDLLGTTSRTLTSELKGSASKFLTLQKSTSKFIQYTGTYFPAYKAYLLLNSNTQSLDIEFENVTAINGVAEAEVKTTPVKVIKNGQLYIGSYNVAGARIK